MSLSDAPEALWAREDAGAPSLPERTPSEPDPPGWTCADVERWLVAAFMVLPDAPIYSPRPNVLKAAVSNVSPSTFDWIAFSADVLGRSSPERLALLTWARVQAGKRMRLRGWVRDVPGGSVEDFCREYGIPRKTFDRRRRRACERIAAARGKAA